MKRRSLWALWCIVLLFFMSACAGTAPQQGTGMAPPVPAFSPVAPAEAEALWKQAEKARQAGNMTAAISTWERIIQSYPNNAIAARALLVVGDTYRDQGQPERAMQYYDYLIYTYSQWEGVGQAGLSRLKALWALGKKKQVQKDATPLYDSLSSNPDAQVALSLFMVDVYRSEKDPETSFDWLSAGFASAQKPDQQKALTRATLDFLNGADDGTVKRLLKKNPNEFMRIFLEYRLIQAEKAPSDQSRERLAQLLSRNPSHPLASEIKTPGRGPAAGPPPVAVAPPAEELPLNPENVGVLIPLNGPFAKYGELVMKGLSTASAEWNEKHPQQPVNLVIKDAQNDGDVAVKSFELLTRNDGAIGVLGPLGAQATKSVAPMANRWNVPLLALTSSEDDESSDNPFVLHIFLDNREMLRTLVRHCKDKLGYTRFAALYPEDRYGQKLSKIFAEVVQEVGGNLMASVSYKEKTTDFKEPLQKLMTIARKNAPPSGVETTPFEVLFLPDQVQTVSMIAPQLPYNNVLGVTLLGTNLWAEAPLVQAGGAYVDGAIFATPYFAESQSPRVQAFRERFETLYNTTPSYLEAQAYDALMLLLQARSALRTPDRTALMQSLVQTQGFEGVTGTYSFSADGKLQRNYRIMQVQNGQLMQLGR
ncbi:MAG: penicillin-binding protein activator [Acidobacteriota bacterium]